MTKIRLEQIQDFITTAEPTTQSTDKQVTSAARLWSMFGGALSSLTTSVKTFVGAINELVASVAAKQPKLTAAGNRLVLLAPASAGGQPSAIPGAGSAGPYSQSGVAITLRTDNRYLVGDTALVNWENISAIMFSSDGGVFAAKFRNASGTSGTYAIGAKSGLSNGVGNGLMAMGMTDEGKPFFDFGSGADGNTVVFFSAGMTRYAGTFTSTDTAPTMTYKMSEADYRRGMIKRYQYSFELVSPLGSGVDGTYRLVGTYFSPTALTTGSIAWADLLADIRLKGGFSWIPCSGNYWHSSTNKPIEALWITSSGANIDYLNGGAKASFSITKDGDPTCSVYKVCDLAT